jgi:outer membrane protein assembly factor BamA
MAKVKELRSQYKNRTTWDQIFAFPGKLLFFPFKLILIGTKEAIIFIDESKIIPKVQDFLIADDGSRVAVPTYTSRIGVGIKYRQYRLLNPESRLSFLVMYGLSQRQRYAIDLERVSLLKDLFYSSYGGLYEKLTTEPFYGIGPDARKEDRTNYTREGVAAKIALGVNIAKYTSFETLLGFELNNILPGRSTSSPSTDEIYESETLPGLDSEVKLAKIEFKLLYLSINRPGNPLSGFDARAKFGYFQQISDDQFKFFKYYFDVEQYIHLFYQRVLMLRIAAEFTEPLSGKQVPFYHLSELSEDRSFRGLNRGRFRDWDMIMGTAEFRYPLSRSLEAMIFADAGQVSSNIFENFASKNLEVSYGGGLRFISGGGGVTKLEMGKSKDGFLVKFTLN